MCPSGNAAEMPTARIYRICVEPHLPPDWLPVPGVWDLSTGYDAEGWPITSFLLETTDQAHLLCILATMFDQGVTLLSVAWERHLGAS